MAEKPWDAPKESIYSLENIAILERRPTNVNGATLRNSSDPESCLGHWPKSGRFAAMSAFARPKADIGSGRAGDCLMIEAELPAVG
jgi:hypothetical protein